MLVCKVCGSKNIQIQAWVKPNSDNEYVDDIDTKECWCENCKDHAPTNWVEHYSSIEEMPKWNLRALGYINHNQRKNGNDHSLEVKNVKS